MRSIPPGSRQSPPAKRSESRRSFLTIKRTALGLPPSKRSAVRWKWSTDSTGIDRLSPNQFVVPTRPPLMKTVAFHRRKYRWSNHTLLTAAAISTPMRSCSLPVKASRTAEPRTKTNPATTRARASLLSTHHKLDSFTRWMTISSSLASLMCRGV